MKNIFGRTKATLFTIFKMLFGPVFYEKIRGFQYLGYWPNIKNPKTFNEKIMRIKLFRPPENAHILSDKLAVRDFVAGIIGEDYLNKLYFSGTSPDEINFDSLPQKFVIKTNNGCEGNIIIKDKSTIDIQSIKAEIRTFLAQKFGYLTNESWYLSIKPQILIEELMEDENGNVPDDYKFFCFNGDCKLVQVNKDRFTDHKILYYDEKWNKLPFGLSHYSHGASVPRPENLDTMIEIAQKLSRNLEFARVDLYSYNGKIRFGEITLAPNAARKPFNPPEYDLSLGKLF